jgi:flavin reductase (DIM6/NTAB) family NADH-FMN oxidoreductase RutF
MAVETAPPPTAPVEDYKAAMRRVVSPVAIVTWRHAGARAGMTVTAICSATTDPPTLVVCLRNDRPAAAQIRGAGTLCVNFLSDEQAEIARRFSASAGGAEGAFDPALWEVGSLGDPALGAAISSFDCHVARSFDEGAHCVILAPVAALRIGAGSGLLYRDGFLRRLSPD